jgi:phage protein D
MPGTMTEATGEEGDMALLYHAADGTNAQQEAESCARRIERRGRAFEVEMPGNPDVAAGMNITLYGFRDGVDGEWVAKIVRHRISRDGWRTVIQGEGTDGAFLAQKAKRLGGEFQPRAKSTPTE